MRDAKAAGYEVVLYHVNVRSPNLSVMRVADRVNKGGHPVRKTRSVSVTTAINR
ncbi:zeta toxin family protein [Mesorhizobium sp. AR07]|uniref:zeta toxin family protein n=1 Tax=Mesorhizobium sp. AR07 TaxID=2865838 RepID=UPI00215ECE9B|nr:zeta toxin family protein [Mesorhizobium sp. AR07]